MSPPCVDRRADTAGKADYEAVPPANIEQAFHPSINGIRHLWHQRERAGWEVTLFVTCEDAR